MRENIMLCYPFEEKRLLKWTPPYFLQRKLDGERCRAICNLNSITLISSEGHEFKYLQHINQALCKLQLIGTELDGELYCHGMDFPTIHSICSRKVNPHPEFGMMEFHIFDIINDQIQDRREVWLTRLQAKIWQEGVGEELKIVQTQSVASLGQIMEALDYFMDEGYEGFILRDRNGLYTRKRSTQIMKFKPHQEDVYEIVGTQQEMDIHGSLKNSLGAFICRGDDSTLFQVGTGPSLTKEKRQVYWEYRDTLPGQYLKVKYQNLTPGKGIPRFPVAIQVLDLKSLV